MRVLGCLGCLAAAAAGSALGGACTIGTMAGIPDGGGGMGGIDGVNWSIMRPYAAALANAESPGRTAGCAAGAAAGGGLVADDDDASSGCEALVSVVALWSLVSSSACAKMWAMSWRISGVALSAPRLPALLAASCITTVLSTVLSLGVGVLIAN